MATKAKVTVSTIIVDLGADKLGKEAAKLKGQFITTGVQSKVKKKSKGKSKSKLPSLVLVASVHEFGTKKAGKNKNITIPKRSYIRSTVDEKSNEWNNEAKKQINLITEGRQTAFGMLDRIGLIIQTAIQNKIRNNISFLKN